MSHILALQVGHFSMQNLDQYSVQINTVGHCGDNAACEGFFGMLKRERTG
jgi:hypothetical protein